MAKKKTKAEQPAESPLRSRIKELRHVKASEIVGAAFNWRTHPEAQVNVLAASIEELGFFDPLDTRELPDGRLELIDGHARRDLIDSRIGPDTLIPCIVTDFTEAEAKKANLLKDPLAAMAECNKDALDALMREVETSSEAIGKMLTDLAEQHGVIPGMQQPTPGAGGDEFEADKAMEGECRVKPGDLWLIDGGKHRLICGDSTDAATVERLMGGEKPFLMVTDPPYGVKLDQSWRDKALGDKAMGPGNAAQVANDDRADWVEVYKLFSGNVAYVWHADACHTIVADGLADAGFEVRQQIIWNKSVMVMGRAAYHWKHEPCWYAVRKGKDAGWSGIELK